MPTSAADVIRPAFQHMVQQLFRPFRFGQWARLAVTGFLAGELSGSGGCSLQVPWRPRGGDRPELFLIQAAPAARRLLFAALPFLILLAIVFFIVLIYINSRMRFVLFDSVVSKECHIKRFWAQRREPAFRYFLFQLLFALAVLTAFAIIGGTAAAIAFAFGWLRNPRQHLLPLILGGIVLFFLVALLMILAGVITVLTKDFVVPQMALENVSVGEGWRRLWLMLNTDVLKYAGYIGLKIVLSIAAAIVTGIAAIVVVLVLAIPMVLIALVAVFGARAIGLAWSVYTLALAIVGGGIAAVILISGIALISVPVIVFFPAYSLHFLAPRYPNLNAALSVVPSS
jgi:hypothetical protein